MKIKCWGVRGSIPTPLQTDEYQFKLKESLQLAMNRGLTIDDDLDSFIKNLPVNLRSIIGGNTTCIEVHSNSGNRYVLDSGTGIVNLGNKLMKAEFGKGQGTINLLFTHTHWDHIQGLPFFKPLYVPGNKVNFYSAYEDLEQRLEKQQEDIVFFPAPFAETASEKSFTLLKAGEKYMLEDDLAVEVHPLAHPGGCFSYKFTQKGRSFVFATDAEFAGEDIEKENVVAGFFAGADLLLLDSQYTLEESFFKFSWGHTSITMAVNCAINWQVKNLVLTHHEPTYDDERLLQNLSLAYEHRSAMGDSQVKIYLAREGMTFRL